jgi:hypothetical protein
MEAPMTPFRTALVLLPALALLTAATLSIGASREAPARAATGATTAVPLKAAKLIVEHNATDRDTGFQGSSTARAGDGSTFAGRAGRCSASKGAAPWRSWG